MTGWCREQGIDLLCLAHHADDQVETFLIRLARGSGVDGLAAMAPTNVRDGVKLLRPLLSFPKAALLETCRAFDQAWIEDPSNTNAAATRVRFRQARDLLAAEGFTTERLLATIGHMQRARGALQTMVTTLLGDACTWDAYGSIALDGALFNDAPEEVALRALSQILTAASGAEFGPRFDALTGLYARLAHGPWRDATLHGCQIQRDSGAIVVSREAAAIADVQMLAPGESVRWDGRFTLRSPVTAPVHFRVTAMTAGAWSALKNEDGPRISPALRAGLPVLCDDQGPAIVPIVNFMREDVRLALGGHHIQCVFSPRRAVADLPPFAGM
jgi:tRNA(Ile)-lysidine synthase